MEFTSKSDAGPVGEQATRVRVNALRQLLERQAAVDHATGILMVIYDVDSITASEVLLSKSAETGLTVAALAEQLVHDVSRLRPEHSGRLVDDVLFRTLQDRFDES